MEKSDKKLLREVNRFHEVTPWHFLGWTAGLLVAGGIFVAGAAVYIYTRF